MCRYGNAKYKIHYACFECRKAFKQPSIQDYLKVKGITFCLSTDDQTRLVYKNSQGTELTAEAADYLEYYNAVRKCPECKNQMKDMGLDFKTPRQSNLKAWKFLKGIYRVGHEFKTCGCDGPGWIPSSYNDYKDYLESRKKDYKKQLESIYNTRKYTTEYRSAASKYWSSKIDAINQEQLNVQKSLSQNT